MEPPTSFSAEALLDETVKVAKSLRPIRPSDVVYGQYAVAPRRWHLPQ
jgi:glucose-6-phosphate 1-dehydrogenase